MGKTKFYIKNSAHFAEKLSKVTVDSDKILVSYNVALLFTKVPIKDTLEYLKELFPKDIYYYYNF